MKTTSTPLPAVKDVKRSWHLIDASSASFGRIVSQAATLLIGKHRPDYTPHMDVGDGVVIINAKDLVLTGNKRDQKNYYQHSRYPGGIKEMPIDERIETRPEELFRDAVMGMLPKNRLRDGRIARLKVYAGAEHPHEGLISSAE